MRKVKDTKGITLIALVITIIVLLILAGVAISMLSGENGILTRAAEAKDKTEVAQKEETTNLLSMELETYFITNNLKYKCAYGFVTGISEGEGVSELQTALQAGGYELKTKDGAAITDDTIITTGMQIQKDEKEIARTVIFGDVDCDGISDNTDAMYTATYLNGGYKPFIVEALDVNHNGRIEQEDAEMIADKENGGPRIDQNKYVTNKKELIIVNSNYIIKEYIENDLPEAFKNQTKYKFKYDNETESYVFLGATIGTSVSEITSLLPNVVIKKGKTTVEQIEEGCRMIMEINKAQVSTTSFKIEI